ncbi:malectin domain-containing carbohydrate-binding protein, partial [Pontibacter silvestris]
EPYFKSSNSRVFNIDVEGKRLATSYDIYKEAGFGKAVVKTYTATVSDGKLDIRLSSVKNNAIISAIEVSKQ